MSQANYTQKLNKVQAFLEETSEILAHETGLVERESKFSGELIAKVMLLGTLKNPSSTLGKFAMMAEQLGLEISPQAISKRLKKAVSFFETLFQEALQLFHNDLPLDVGLLKQFSGIYVTDSTQVELPEKLLEFWRGSGGAASRSALKTHLVFDYLHGCLSAIELTEGRDPDTNFCYPELVSQGLYLQDMGYFKLENFRQITEANAYFISRLKPHVVCFETDDTGTRIDLLDYLQAIEGTCHEEQLCIGVEAHLPVRALFVKCSPEVAQERRRKARAYAKKKKRQISQKHLDSLDWHIFITNLPISLATFEQVLLLYRIRWQIELIFKCLKSQFAFDHILGYGRAFLLCRLYSRLILFVLLCNLSAPARFNGRKELSLYKAFGIFSNFADRFASSIASAWVQFECLLEQMMRAFCRFATKERRIKKPSTLDSILLVEA